MHNNEQKTTIRYVCSRIHNFGTWKIVIKKRSVLPLAYHIICLITLFRKEERDGTLF